GFGEGSSAAVKLWRGWNSDRIASRRQLAVGGYGGTVLGLGLLIAVTAWPQVIVARALAWMGRGLRQPIRSAMLAGSVEKKDLGKAFGFHEALDTAGALIGPSVAFVLLSTGHSFRTIFGVALIPGVVCVVLFALITRDPRRGRPEPVSLRVPLPPNFWRLMVPVAIFGLGNFATAFFTLRAAQIMQPGLGTAFGVLNGINGAADLASSVVAGALWTLVSSQAALGFGAVLCATAAVVLWLRQPKPV